MKRFTIILFFGLLTSMLANNGLKEKGMTDRLPDDAVVENYRVVGETKAYKPLKKNEVKKKGPCKISGVLSEIVDLDFYLPAGEKMALEYDALSKTAVLIYPENYMNFGDKVNQAIELCPNWLKADLKSSFYFINENVRRKWADAIIDCENSFRDEIAFCVAHLSPEYLESDYAYPELLEENARLIYEYDEILDYVELVEKSDDDGAYTTTRYRTLKNGIDTAFFEAPKEIYYWYLVYPKITDEIPAYIDPEKGEYDTLYYSGGHDMNIVGPDEGYFWRDYLFNHKDRGFMTLKSRLEGCKVLWNGMKGLKEFDDNAIARIDRWIGSVMEFTSYIERPHQPIRIYHRHVGRCGEHADIRSAAARTCLIPANSIATMSTDHTWNEFWHEDWFDDKEREWVHWDGDGAINDFLVYERDWGKVLGSVFLSRGDGYWTNVTDRYSASTGRLDFYILDKNNRSVDGAKIILYIKGDEGRMYLDSYGVTDNNGLCQFEVGTNRSYFVRVASSIGNNPEDYRDYKRVVGYLDKDEVYSCSLRVDGATPRLQDQGIEEKSGNEGQIRMNLEFSSQLLRSQVLYDDLTVGAPAPHFRKEEEEGRVDVMVLDGVNYQLYANGEDFKALFKGEDLSEIMDVIPVRDQDKMYIVFSNEEQLMNLQRVKGSMEFFGKNEMTKSVKLDQNHPNPFSAKMGETVISYQIPEDKKIELEVYNLLGRKVRKLDTGLKKAYQSYNVSWDGRDDDGDRVSSGVYFYCLKVGDNYHTKKMLYLK